jgi:hypothetical protein
MICYVAVLCDISLNRIDMIPSTWQLGRWFYWCAWTCLSINKLVVLRCKIFWSCAQQLLSFDQAMVKLAPYYLASDAGLRLGIVCEVLSLPVCPLLSICWCLQALCDWGAWSVGHVPSTNYTEWFWSLRYASEVQTEAFIHLSQWWVWAKHIFAKLRALINSNICWKHALAVMCLQGFYLLPVVVQ